LLDLNTLRKAGFLPYLLSRSFAGETREGEQAVIYQQPAGRTSTFAMSINPLKLRKNFFPGRAISGLSAALRG
jgi:hypothetical protein